MNEILREAIQSDDVSVLLRVLSEEEIAVDCLSALSVTEQGSTCLMLAAAFGSLSILRYLVEECLVEINHTNSNLTSALIFACNMEQVGAVEYLVHRGVNTNIAMESGDTALHVCASNNSAQLILLLLDAGAHINAINEQLETSLYCAVCAGGTEAVELLLSRGADVNIKNKVGVSPALYSCISGDVTLASLLLSQPGVDTSNFSLQVIASRQEEVKEEELLKEQQKKDIIALLRHTSFQPLLDLRRACERDDVSELTSLLQQWPGLRAESSLAGGGANALMVASLHGSISVAKYLLEQNLCALEATSDDGRRALSYGSWAGRVEMVRFLLEQGAESEGGCTDSGQTSLSYACQNGHEQVVELLLAKGAKHSNIKAGNLCNGTCLVTCGENAQELKFKNEHIRELLCSKGWEE